jgi:protein gp37
MSDLFHKAIPRRYIDSVFDTMEQADWHVFQVLTKRSSLLRDYVNRRYGSGFAPPHIWLGVSIEDKKALIRMKHLKQAQASMRFISFEPLLGPLGQLDLGGIHWAIVGGESGPGFRPIDVKWVREIRDQCRTEGVAFFFKQWGGRSSKAGGNLLDRRKWLQKPLSEKSYLIARVRDEGRYDMGNQATHACQTQNS